MRFLSERSAAAMLSDVNELRSTVEKNKAEQRARNLEEELDAAANNANPTEYEALLIDLLGMLRAGGPVERLAAVDVLADVVSNAYGDDGSRIGRAVRESGALEDLAELLSLDEAREASLLVIGNLVSDTVDKESAATKIALHQCNGAAAALVACLDDAEDVDSLAFAVGALQNLCHDRDWSEQLAQWNLHTTFEALLAHPHELIVRYASGALKNMTATLQNAALVDSQNARAAIEKRSDSAELEEFEYKRAAATIVRMIQKMPADVRLERLLRAKERAAYEAKPKKPERSQQSVSNAAAALRSRGSTSRGNTTPGASSSLSLEYKPTSPVPARASPSPSKKAVSLAKAQALPNDNATVDAAEQGRVPSDASSSHSGSTAYYSVASSATREKEAKNAPAAVAGAGGQPGHACFEV